MNDYLIPPALQSVTGEEKVDFSVLAQRVQLLKKTVFNITFGLVIFFIVATIFRIFLGPVLDGGELHYSENGIQRTATADNMGRLIIPGIVLAVFMIVAVVTVSKSVYQLFQNGGYFVGTEKRLINYRKGYIKIYDWEQFTGSMDVNISTGDIMMVLRSGKVVSRKNGDDQFVNDLLYISGVDNVLDLERKCRIRIQENDPEAVVQA